MASVIVGTIIAVAVICAVVYMIKSKRKGKKCLGCPYSDSCNGHCGD